MNKTLMRIVVAQLVMTMVLAAVVVWIILPDGISVEWRGLHFYENPATLQTKVQLWPIGFSIEKEEVPQRNRPFLPIMQDDYWKDQQQKEEINRLNNRIDCLKSNLKDDSTLLC